MLSFCAFDVLNISFKVFAPESQRITCINDLHDQVRTLKDSPKLSPHLEIAFKWCEKELISLLESVVVATVCISVSIANINERTLRVLVAIPKRHPSLVYQAAPKSWPLSMGVSSVPSDAVCSLDVFVMYSSLHPLIGDTDCAVIQKTLKLSSRCDALKQIEPSEDVHQSHGQQGRTSCELSSGQLSGIEKFIKIPFLCNRLKPSRGVDISCVLNGSRAISHSNQKSTDRRLTSPDSRAWWASLTFLLMIARPSPLGLGFLPFAGA